MSGDNLKNSEVKPVLGTMKTACAFCRTRATDELNLGPVYESNGLIVHYFCLLTASSLPQNGQDDEGILGFYLRDIQNELKATATRMCIYCKKKGASVSCCAVKCRLWFHLTCGRKNNSLHQFFGRFKSFCSSHRPKQRIEKTQLDLKESNNEVVCPICYDSVVINSLDTLWAPCCKKNAWFHRDCVQKLALSAGYFFKCPLCNNEAIFRESMEKFGVYVPQRDALWEQVPNAYQELLYQYRRCDAPQCKCPRGRTHNGQSNWELIRCKTCGSQGVHISCGRLKFSDPEWLCRLCTDVLASEGAGETSATVRSRLPSSTSSSSRNGEVESAVPNVEPPADNSQLSSSSLLDSTDPPRRRKLNPRSSCVARSDATVTSSTSSNLNKPQIVSSSEITHPPIKRSKPCPKRFKKDCVDIDAEDSSNVKKTETSMELERDPSGALIKDYLAGRNTSISLIKENPLKQESSSQKVTNVDSDSDGDIEVLEVHRVLERKSLTANDGTKLEVHPVAEKEKVVYEIRDFPEPSSSTAVSESEVKTAPKLPEESSASSTSTNNASWRSVDPKLFYKPGTSTEKCDNLKEDTCGSPQSLEALVKSSGGEIHEIRTAPKTYSAKPERKFDPLIPSLTVIPLTKAASSHSNRISVKKFAETVPSRPLTSAPLPRNSSISVTLSNQNIGMRLEKPIPPARRDSIEEITIIDEIPPTKSLKPPSTSSNLPAFQPQIVNVRSCAKSNSGPALGPTVVGPTVMRPAVPIGQHTQPVLETNVLVCTTGLWLPTSESYIASPIFNPTHQSTSQPVGKPAITLQAMETDLNIKISDVRHSNEFFNSPSNSLNSPVNFRAAGEIGGRTTFPLPPQMTAITPPPSLSNIVPLQGQPRPPVNPVTTEIQSEAHLTSSKTGLIFSKRFGRKKKKKKWPSVSHKDDSTPGWSGPKSSDPSKFFGAERVKKPTGSPRLPASDVRKELGSGCHSFGVGDVSNIGPAAFAPEVLKESTLSNQQNSQSKPNRKSLLMDKMSRPCPKRFKPYGGVSEFPESSSVGTSASQSNATDEMYVEKVAQKPPCKLCPKCLRPRRKAR